MEKRDSILLQEDYQMQKYTKICLPNIFLNISHCPATIWLLNPDMNNALSRSSLKQSSTKHFCGSHDWLFSLLDLDKQEDLCREEG